MSYRAISIIIPQNPNFIDGTVEGTKTNYPDDKVDHDHTYYGNGCPNGWGTDGSTGSDVACSSRIVEGKNDPQYIGVYYTFQAATSGSGGSLTTDNTNPSDTFCPLGWQLPYGGTGGDYYDQSRSWKYLFEQYNYGDSGDGSKAARSYPLSYVFSGDIMFRYGTLFNQGSGGFIWSPTVYTSQGAYRLTFWGGNLQLYRLDSKLSGYAIRCVHHFIDGTVAGNPANMTVAPYKDGTVTNDHTYYGRGCKNGWGTGGEGGSQTPCADSDAGGRYVTTADGETQKNGTYFNFQAATVGAGGAMDTDKSDSPYTFCPLGWQLPYSGTGGDYDDKSKTWNHLFKSYGLHIGDGTATDATKVKSYPFSYVYSGLYGWYTGRLYLQSSSGYYWSSTVVGSAGAYHLTTWSSAVSPANTANKALGDAIRCVNYFSIPHRRHGGRNECRN